MGLSFGPILIPILGSIGQISGAHVNPAVTLGLATAGRFPWCFALPYRVSLQVSLVEALIAFTLVFTVIATATDPRVPAGMDAVAIGVSLAAGVLLGGPVSGGADRPVDRQGAYSVRGGYHF